MYDEHSIDQSRILTAKEITTVLGDLRRKARSKNTRQNLIIFSLSTFCGLRVSEIVGLTLANVKLNREEPCIYIPKSLGKGKKKRTVPIWGDPTIADLRAWKAEREDMEASSSDPFVCSLANGPKGHKKTGLPSLGNALITRNAQARWKASIKVLGSERVADLSIHSGRHSFCSHSLDRGVSLACVRDAAGHASISTTSIYLHKVGNIERNRNALDFE